MKYDASFLLNALDGKLENLHQVKTRLRSACPKCGGSDRFYTSESYNFASWHCHSCNYVVSTAELLGLDWTVQSRPAVKQFEAGPDADRIAAIRALYADFVTFAQSSINDRLTDYLASRGVSGDFGLGYIDGRHYRQWIDSLNDAQLALLSDAGLPDTRGKSRLSGFAAMFAGGRMGKVVIPYCDESGAVIDVQTRSISPSDTVRYVFPKGKYAERGADVPYGLQFLKDARRIVITEGAFKSITPMAKGSNAPVIGLRSTSDLRAEYLPYFRNRLLILAFDADEKKEKSVLTPGQAAAVNAGRFFQAHGIDVMILAPEKLAPPNGQLLLGAGPTKGLDDYVNAYGIEAFNALLEPKNLVTLAEFEAGLDVSKLKNPRSDIGTVRTWTPIDFVDEVIHQEIETVSIDEARRTIKNEAARHFQEWHKGQPQLMITSSAGAGKTTNTLEAAKEQAGTIAVFLPNHNVIDEKIKEGTLAGFRHIYGRRWDDPEDGEVWNCQQADLANALSKKQYNVSRILCPTCPFADWCVSEGYQSQFLGNENRAYTHGHLFTNYPENESMAIIDELDHSVFIDTMTIRADDILKAMQKEFSGPQRDILDAIIQTLAMPGDLDGAVFYEVLERFYPDLKDTAKWGGNNLIQGVLDGMAHDYIKAHHMNQEVEFNNLPIQFADKLFNILNDDVRRMNAGLPPTGRLSMNARFNSIHLRFSRAPLPDWFYKMPVAILNATADPAIMQELIDDLRIVSPQVEIRAGNEIIQDITRNNAKSSFVGDSPRSKAARSAWLDRIRGHINSHPGGEKDALIVTTKALEAEVQKAFPLATVAYYRALEGRNDLQAGLTILANSPPVNLDAVKREAVALFPGVDTSLVRRAVAFDEQNAAGELLAVEQIDAIDPRVQALLWQHRDAVAIQAVHRSRIVYESGRSVVIMFARPIPGVQPTRIISERQDDEIQSTALAGLVLAAQEIIHENNQGFNVAMLAERAGITQRIVRKYWADTIDSIGLHSVSIPCIQLMQNGAKIARQLQIAITEEFRITIGLHVKYQRYNTNLITVVSYVQCFIPQSWEVDISSLKTDEKPPEPAPAYIPAVVDAKRMQRALTTGLQSQDQLVLAAVKRVESVVTGAAHMPQDELMRYLYVLDSGLHFAIKWSDYSALPVFEAIRVGDIYL